MCLLYTSIVSLSYISYNICSKLTAIPVLILLNYVKKMIHWLEFKTLQSVQVACPLSPLLQPTESTHELFLKGD